MAIAIAVLEREPRSWLLEPQDVLLQAYCVHCPNLFWTVHRLQSLSPLSHPSVLLCSSVSKSDNHSSHSVAKISGAYSSVVTTPIAFHIWDLILCTPSKGTTKGRDPSISETILRIPAQLLSGNSYSAVERHALFFTSRMVAGSSSGISSYWKWLSQMAGAKQSPWSQMLESCCQLR